jgi:hypothetical protein
VDLKTGTVTIDGAAAELSPITPYAATPDFPALSPPEVEQPAPLEAIAAQPIVEVVDDGQVTVFSRTRRPRGCLDWRRRSRAVAIAVAGFFWAGWAPADPVGSDILVFDQVSLFQLTTPGQPTRTAGSGRLGSIDWSSFPKGSTQTGMFTAEYREERQYSSEDEESRYGLEFKVNQAPV